MLAQYLLAWMTSHINSQTVIFEFRESDLWRDLNTMHGGNLTATKHRLYIGDRMDTWFIRRVQQGVDFPLATLGVSAETYLTIVLVGVVPPEFRAAVSSLRYAQLIEVR